MKGCSLFNAKYYLCNRNSERSLVIQNNELSRISLISKSLPIQPVFNRRVLCFKHLAQYHIFFSDSNNFESKGFIDAVEVTDFPIRDHKVILVLRRRRWLDTRTGKSFSLPLKIDITASGTRYSKEFGAFLKATYGDIPSDLPYA